MPKQQITSAKIRQPSGHFSHATMVAARGRIVFISGMTARRADGTISGIGAVEAQTRQGWENLKAAVGGGGGKMDDICRVDVYVRNMEHFEQIHKVRREYFRPPAPASTMVEGCKMTSPDYLIEINAIAVIAECHAIRFVSSFLPRRPPATASIKSRNPADSFGFQLQKIVEACEPL